MTRLTWALSAFVAAGFVLDVQGQQPVATGRSKTWSVSVVRATQKAYSDQYYELVLDLRFEYVGPAGEIAAPPIAVVDEKGTKYTPPIGTSFPAKDVGLALWLHSSVMAEQTKRSLKPGEKFGANSPLTYEFVPLIPRDSKELKLVFADVPPIVLRPTKAK